MAPKSLTSLFILVILISSNIYAQAPDTVWVNNDYDTTTTGWGTTHFAVIQNGIDAVAKNGIVYVAAGTWNENIRLYGGKSMIGAGIGQSFINGDGTDCTVVINDTGSVIKQFTIDSPGNNWMNFAIDLENACDITVENIHILDKGIGVSASNNNIVSNNLIEGQGSIFIDGSWNNHIENNELSSVLYPGQIWVLDNSCNNTISDNKIIGNPNDASCTGIRSLYSSNNVYLNNTTKGFRVHILMTLSDKNIIAGNNISGHRWNKQENGGGIVVFRGDSNTIINNNIDSVIDGAITLFCASSDNILQSNSIRNSERGIDVYYNSNNNNISNNDVRNNIGGIILDNTNGNEVYENNIVDNQLNGYDDGTNEWDMGETGNYWSDYSGRDEDNNGIGDTPRSISPAGNDYCPSMQAFPVSRAVVPSLQQIPENSVSDSTIEITDSRVITNEHRETNKRYLVKNGGALTLDGVEWKAASDFIGNEIEVEAGGALEIINSKIYAHGGAIDAKIGATLDIENSELVGLGNWDGGGGISIECDNAVIKNNIIRKSYTCINLIEKASGAEIINNKMSEAFNGIRSCCNTSSNNIIEGNDFFDIITSGIFANGLYESTISDNTFKDIRCETMLLTKCGTGCNSGQNIIYGNNFFNCGLSLTSSNNNWSKNNRGNYYSDFLDRYPGADEHSSLTGVWGRPYVFSDVQQDNYPLIDPVYSDTVITAPATPTLLTPQPDAVVSPSAVEFSWNPSPGATAYRLQVSENTSFGAPVFNKGGIIQSSEIVDSLQGHTDYYWRVLAEDSGVISKWSYIHHFITSAQTGIEESSADAPLSFGLNQSYPNPFNPTTTIEYSLPKASLVTLKVYDILGREVATLVSSRKLPGRYRVTFDGTRLSSGVYFYRLSARPLSGQAGSYRAVKKLLLVK